jgi:Flp pilus assembly pilin Flp
MFSFLRDRCALETSEFAVLAAAIIVVVYGAFKLLGGNVADIVTQVANYI